MKICHYAEFKSSIKGGIRTSIENQRKALEENDVNFTESPLEEFDLLHLNTVGPLSFMILILAKLRGSPVVIHAHVTARNFRDTLRFSNIISPVVGLYLKFIYSKADILITPSKETREYLKSRGLKTEIKSVSNGVDVERLQEFQKIGEKSEFKDDEFTVVNLSLVFERKGLSDFIEVARKTPDINYIWFGSKPSGLACPTNVKQTIESSPDNVCFPGYIDDVREAFGVADVFFLPTQNETQGMVFLEAAYCGIPILTRDIEVLEGILEDESNCLKADSNEEFKKKLIQLQNDQELRERLSNNAEKMAEKHTLEKIGDKLENIYSKVKEK